MHIFNLFRADPLKFGYEERWNTYMQSMQSIASTKAYMTLPGNHEGEQGEQLPSWAGTVTPAARPFRSRVPQRLLPAGPLPG